MGLLVEGVWRDQWYDTSKSRGRFERQESQFRNWITPDGSPGPSGEGGFAAEAGRYHLYVSLACPWAHRTLIFRRLKRLEPLIGVSVVDPRMGSEGWVFGDFPAATPDEVNGAGRLYEIYLKAAPQATTRVSVPVLWDRKLETIVSNESAEIIRMFNSAFDGLTGDTSDYYPAPRREEIDALNASIYDRVNNGVYKAGFATTQEAYEEASRRCSTNSTPSTQDCRPAASCSARSRPRPTGGCSPRSPASTPSISATSSATAAGSRTTPICPVTSATSTKVRACGRR